MRTICESAESAAKFIAELVRQGIQFSAKELSDGQFEITCTGGF